MEKDSSIIGLIKNSHKMTRTGAILSIISTIVGGGIVSLPHSFYFIGIIFGTILIILAGAQSTYSIYLYLKAKDYLPGQP